MPLDTRSADVGTQRRLAIAEFVATARRLIPDPAQATPQALAATDEALGALGQRSELFPPAHFLRANHAHWLVWRLHEDADGQHALYLRAGPPGQARQSHEHSPWALVADVAPPEGPGERPALQLHFHGRAPSALPQRIRHAQLTPAALHAALRDGAEIAVLDVRETGVYSHGHLLVAASAPWWRLPLQAPLLVPRRDTRVVLVDGDETIAHEAAATLLRLGWTDLSVLAGGTRGWAAAGHEVFTGTNVPSKALGEVVEVELHTPSIDADELHARVQRGDDLVVVDSRTPEEYQDFTLPWSHSLPGAELVYRIGELAPRPETLVVVNCAGRTRSIVGAQTLIDAGIPNRVVSLRDGTMAWLLSGRELVHGRRPQLPEPGPAALAAAREQARRWADRAGVRVVDAATLRRLQGDSSRTLYRFDVRTRAEYEAGHLEGWRWAPGGQLVQATDEYLATRRSRIVLADWYGVRALTTAARLTRLGDWEVLVHPVDPHAAIVVGPEPVRVLRPHGPAPLLAPEAAAAALDAGALLFDVERRSAYVRQHIRGARFAVPDRLTEFIADAPPGQAVLITSPDGVLAGVVAAHLATRVGDARPVHAIAGGTRAWQASGRPVASGAEGVLTGDDDHWLSPYQLADHEARDAGFRAYLDWELGLVAQLQRDGQPDIGLRKTAVLR